MRATAYLIAMIDTRTSPPKMIGVDLFSEPHPTGPLTTLDVVALEAHGDSYSDAIQNLAKILSVRPMMFDWILPMLSERARVALFGKALPRVPGWLAPLSQIPKEEWLGLRVYHPGLQQNGMPYWKGADYPVAYQTAEVEQGWTYRLGTISKVDFESNPHKVWFFTDTHKTVYSDFPSHLWTYREILRTQDRG